MRNWLQKKLATDKPVLPDYKLMFEHAQQLYREEREERLHLERENRYMKTVLYCLMFLVVVNIFVRVRKMAGV